MPRCFLIFALACMASAWAAPGLQSPAILSDNHHFSLEITPAGDNQTGLVGVFEHQGQAKKLSWSRNVTSQLPAWTQFTGLEPPMLGDDGQTVVLHNLRSGLEDSGWLFVSRSGAPRQILFPDMARWLG